MQTEELWNALEADADAGRAGKGGWLLRLAQPSVSCPIFVGLELSSRRRAVLLSLPSIAMPSRSLWPRSKGLEPLAIAIEGKSHFGVRLKESRFADVFSALVADLVRRVMDATRPEEQVRAFLGQLGRWQRFLSASFDGLSEEAQRGLWGELFFLRQQLLPRLGVAAVTGWKGGERAHQDFQFERGAIEVKSTLAKKPQVVRITSERQLDESSWPLLILNVIMLDVRERGGESLPALISSLRSKLVADATAEEQFEEQLLLSGYLETHATRYADKGYVVRSQKVLHVHHGFPRLVEKDLPEGLGNVEYGLAIAACEAFALKASDLARILQAWAKPQNRREEKT
jgi:Putative  PD-(D/E)XK family member, (DUF4420)